MKIPLNLSLYVWLIVVSCSLRADPSAYAEFALNGAPFSVGTQSTLLGNAELRAGAYLTNLIAAEVFVSQGVLNDDDDGVESTQNLGFGAGLRFESPSRDGTKAFILLGYASHEMELSSVSSGAVLAEETFDGFSFGVGIEEQLFSKTSPWFVNARWQRHYSSGDIELDNLGLAVRYAF